MKRIAIFITMLLAAITASAQTDDDNLYDGKIGDFNIKVSINFRNVVDAAVGDSVGYYYYNGTFKNSQGKEYDFTWDVMTIDD